MACPTGWEHHSWCNEKTTCGDDTCDSQHGTGTMYLHKYERCKNKKNGDTDCFWYDSEYFQCC